LTHVFLCLSKSDILAAESLQYTDASNTVRCIDALYVLRDRITEAKEDDWILRVDHALCNAFCRWKEWRMALDTLDHMSGLIDKREDDPSTMQAARQVEICSRQGRIFLQVGALPEAAIVLEQARQYADSIPASASDSSWVVQKVPSQVAMNQGLLEFAHGNFEESMTAFKQAMDMLRQQSEPLESSPEYCRELYLGPFWVDSYHQMLTHGWNNMSLAALYSCRMKEAVRMMEALIRENPPLYLSERLAFNLCTLYELGSDTASSARKKRVLQLVAKRFYLHDIGPESFRIN